METIVPSVDTTKEELQERVDYMVNTASHLEELAETDEHEAMKEFIALKNFAYEEYHVLTLQKMKKQLIVMCIYPIIEDFLHIYILRLGKCPLDFFTGILMNSIRQIWGLDFSFFHKRFKFNLWPFMFPQTNKTWNLLLIPKM